MGTISKNFSYKEFEESKKAEERHIVNVINTAEIRDNVKALVENVLQPLRDAWGGPLVINSGYRCPELNAAVDGRPTSQHLKGMAADVRVTDPVALARLAVKMRLPYDQLIVYPTFVHFSHRSDGENRGQVLYSPKYRGPKI